MPDTTPAEVLDSQVRPDVRRWLRCRMTVPDGRPLVYEVPASRHPHLLAATPPPSRPFTGAPGGPDEAVPVRKRRHP